MWNDVNELNYNYLKKHNKCLSAYDIAPYSKGTSKECGLHSTSHYWTIGKDYLCCGVINNNRSKDRTNLGIREW